MQDRAERFAAWLCDRPERHIAVVSHCDFLDAFTMMCAAKCVGPVRNHMRYDFSNAELRSIVLLRPRPAPKPWTSRTARRL